MDFLVVFRNGNFSFLMTGLAATVFYTITGFVLSMMIGLIVAFGQLSKKKVCRTVAEIYLSWFRSTPLLVQLCLFTMVCPFSSILTRRTGSAASSHLACTAVLMYHRLSAVPLFPLIKGRWKPVVPWDIPRDRPCVKSYCPRHSGVC